MIPDDDQKNLPEDENTPEKRAEKIWQFFGKKENGKSWFITGLFIVVNSIKSYFIKLLYIFYSFYIILFLSFPR